MVYQINHIGLPGDRIRIFETIPVFTVPYIECKYFNIKIWKLQLLEEDRQTLQR